jgi:ubiquinone/menaquinone biosynthesis C-methylase UbiE
VDAPALTPLATALLGLPAPERALLIGCGDGDPALLLAREFPAARVRAVDSSEEAVRTAQSRVGLDPEGRLAFKRASPRSLPYPDAFFDLVVQVGGRIVPRELARVLRDGGGLIVVGPLGEAWRGPGRLSRWLLSSRGFAIERDESAADGNFLVARLTGRH